MTALSLIVNGHEQRVAVDESMPLLWVLRDTLGLMGTKYGCGKGLCGACTVHLDGVATRSCVTSVSSVGQRRITTIEGLDSEGRHPLQQAWQAEDVPQCGYCQAGQIMTAAAFLKTTPHPSDDQVAAAMSGNLCRCGTYHRIHRAVLRAATANTAGGAR